jgi:hypothetical protein
MSALSGLKDNPGPLRLADKQATSDRLRAHVKLLETQATSDAQAEAHHTVRLQDKAVERTQAKAPSSEPLAAQPRGLWRRLRGWLGF